MKWEHTLYNRRVDVHKLDVCILVLQTKAVVKCKESGLRHAVGWQSHGRDDP